MSRPWPVSSRTRAELVPGPAAASLQPHWQDLASQALEPNPFFAPARCLSAIWHLPEGQGESILAAWRGDGETRRLVGLLPLVRPRGRWLNPFPIRRAAAHDGTLSTPLLDADRPVETLRIMLAALAEVRISGLLLPFMPAEGPVAAALAELSAEFGHPLESSGLHRRALLRSPLPGRDYLRATLETRRRKELDRQRRRLADEGRLAFSVARSPDEVMPALERFLELESAGWKGRAGTAMARSRGAAAFIRATARAEAADNSFQVATLTLDDRVIAAGLVGIAGRRAFYLKTAYDESYARFSPGLLLTAELTPALLDDPGIDDADSIAVADHPMIDRIWTERLAVATVLIATRSGGGVSFRAANRFERARETALAAAKGRLVKLRRWRRPGLNASGQKCAAPAAS